MIAAETGKWKFFDYFQTGLPTENITSPEKAFTEFLAILEQRELKEKQEAAEYWKNRNAERRIAEQERSKNFYEAMQKRDIATMRQLYLFDRDLALEYFSSGFGTTAELNDYMIRFVQHGEDFRKVLASRKGQDTTRQQQKIASEKEAYYQRQRLKAEQNREFREAKLADDAQWLKTMATNFNKVNQKVKQEWDKHQTEMYEKGYIELPK